MKPFHLVVTDDVYTIYYYDTENDAWCAWGADQTAASIENQFLMGPRGNSPYVIVKTVTQRIVTAMSPSVPNNLEII